MRWHRLLSWVGGAILLLFTFSALLHPLMSWTGPKAAKFYAPKMTLSAAQVSNIPEVLKNSGIAKASTVQVVPSEQGAVLQVTPYKESDNRAEPRRYFDLNTAQPLLNYDAKQAAWLARHYTGLADAEITEQTFQTQFDHAYPWVNRLLPVYKVSFDTPDNKTAYIHTELGALAGLSNDWKTRVQGLFRTLHTFSWIDNSSTASETVRLLLMVSALIVLGLMALTGAALVFTLKSRKMPKKRKVHRLLAYAIWLPLFMFTFSGLYHLIYNAYDSVDSPNAQQFLRVSKPLDISVFADDMALNTDWLEEYEGTQFHQVSLVAGNTDNALLYRLSLPKDKVSNQPVTRKARFQGMTTEKPAIYVAATGKHQGQTSDVTDKDMAVFYARSHIPDAQVTGQTLITHFSPDYDFRNKRLPVWRVDFNTPSSDKVFIDPATGMLIDRLDNAGRYEGYSFSFLHKWNFLRPIGRQNRDIVIVLFLLAMMIATVVGYVMLLKKKLKTR